MNTGSIVAFILSLFVDVIAPLTLAAILLRRNFRNRPLKSRERVFWLSTLGYLTLPALIAWGLIETATHPQVEGFAFFSGAITLWFVTAPGSIFAAAVALGVNWLPEPALLPSHTLWFVIGALAWAIVNAALLRRIVQLVRATQRARALTAAPPPVPAAP